MLCLAWFQWREGGRHSQGPHRPPPGGRNPHSDRGGLHTHHLRQRRAFEGEAAWPGSQIPAEILAQGHRAFQRVSPKRENFLIRRDQNHLSLHGKAREYFLISIYFFNLNFNQFWNTLGGDSCAVKFFVGILKEMWIAEEINSVCLQGQGEVVCRHRHFCVMPSVSNAFPSPLSEKTLQEYWNNGLRYWETAFCPLFLPNHQIHFPVCPPFTLFLLVSFSGRGTKRTGEAGKAGNYKNLDKKRGVYWAYTIAPNWQEPSCSPQKQRDLGKALCFCRCLVMLASSVRTRFVHRALGSLLRHKKDWLLLGASRGTAIWGKCLAFPLCPISLLAVGGAEATSFQSQMLLLGT